MYQRIRYFLKAAETGSFSTAARDMFISSQALTKQIKVLEKELGGELFERTPNGVRLTKFGAMAVTELSDLVRQTDYAIDHLKEYAATDKVHVNIGIYSALSRDRLVTPVVSFLLSFFPDYQISLEILDMNEGASKLDSGKLDLFLAALHEQMDTAGYECLSFGSCEAKVVVSLTHPWVMKETVTKKDLEKDTLIKIRIDENKYKVPRQENYYFNLPCKNLEQVENYNTMQILLRQGKGFAVVPTAFFDCDQAQLKSFDYPGKKLRYDAVLVFKADARIKGLDAIVETLKEEFELEPRPEK